MTLEAWVYPTQSGNWRTVLLKEGSNFLSYALYTDDGNAPAGGWIHIGSTDHVAEAANQLPLNQWSHLAATYDGATLKLYINGALAGTKNVTGSITTTNGAFRIGGNSIWGEWFNGIIDEVRIYNRALSVSEIQFDMTTPI
jgi:hypothetical protein